MVAMIVIIQLHVPRIHRMIQEVHLIVRQVVIDQVAEYLLFISEEDEGWNL